MSQIVNCFFLHFQRVAYFQGVNNTCKTLKKLTIMKLLNHSFRIKKRLISAFSGVQSVVVISSTSEIRVYGLPFSALRAFVREYNKKTRSCWIYIVVRFGCKYLTLIPKMSRVTSDHDVVIVKKY